MKHYNIPVFIPHLGCPHDCVFCNQRKITGFEDTLDYEGVKTYIESYLASFEEKAHIEIAFFGGSFTGIPSDLQEAYLALAYTYVKSGQVDGIRLSTRPDYINQEVLDRLLKYGVTMVELGVQSMDDRVLVDSHRGYKPDRVLEAAQMIRASGLGLGLQMMIGLPGDSLAKSLETAKTLIALKADCVRIYPTLVIEHTGLADLFEAGLYDPLTLDQAVTWVKAIYPLFLQAGIEVIRVGLQDTEDLEAACLAGPYHPSFKHLVISSLILDQIKACLGSVTCKRMTLYCHPKQVSNLVGQKRSNLLDLEDRYQIKKIKVYPKEGVLNQVEIHIDDQVVLCPLLV